MGKFDYRTPERAARLERAEVAAVEGTDPDLLLVAALVVAIAGS